LGGGRGGRGEGGGRKWRILLKCPGEEEEVGNDDKDTQKRVFSSVGLKEPFKKYVFKRTIIFLKKSGLRILYGEEGEET